MAQQTMIRTPVGGMNQDDSLITPSKEASGKNMFEVGDYRYAANARIGSSRTEHTGDLENIRGMDKVVDYFASSNVMTNPSFIGSLSPWLQTVDPGQIDFAYNAGAARAHIVATPGTDPGPAPDFIAKGTFSGGDGASVTPAYPASIVANDLLFLMAESKQFGGSFGVLSDPVGWTRIRIGTFRNNTPANVGNAGLWFRVADGSETGTVTVTRSGSTGSPHTFMAQIYQYRGGVPVVENNSIGDTRDGNNTVQFPAVTIGGAHRNVLAFYAGLTTNDITTPAGYVGKALDTFNNTPEDAILKLLEKHDVSSDGLASCTGGTANGYCTFHVGMYNNIMAPIPTPFTTEVLYQTLVAPIAGKTAPISISMAADQTITSGVVKIIFMNGGTVIGSSIIYNGSINNFTYADNVVIPAGCDGIGIQVSGIVSVDTNLDVQFINLVVAQSAVKPTGTEKVIGRVQDDEFLRVWYCVWNSEGHHCIRYWDKVTNGIYEVLQWEGLNWLSTDYIAMAKIDNWIAFTGDMRNPPRLIDVNSITSLSIALGADFREFHISHHKWAPTAPPVPRIFYDGVTNNFDRLKNKIFQFSYRYNYKGNLKSRWSPYSKATTTCLLTTSFYASNTISSIELDIPGCLFDDPNDTVTPYNFFDHNDIKFQTAVDSIEIAYKDGEFELWKLWKRIPINSLFTRYHYFDGLGNSTPISMEDFTQLYDTVPFIAGTVEAIDNRFMYGNILEDKPAVKFISATDQQVYTQDRGDDSIWLDARAAGYPAMANPPRDRLLRYNATARQTFKDRTKQKWGIQFLHRNGWRTAVYTEDDWLIDPQDSSGADSGIVAVSFGFKLPSSFSPPDWAVGYQIMMTNALNMDSYMFGAVNAFKPLIDNPATFLDQLDLPQDVRKSLMDYFMNTTNLTGDELNAETQKEIQSKIDNPSSKERKKLRLNKLLKINRNIGIGSTDPGLALFNRNLQKWGTREPIAVKLRALMRKSQVITLIDNSSRILIDVNNWTFGAPSAGTTMAPTAEYPLNNLYYNFRQGDRIRFIGADVASPTSSDYKEYDVLILEYTGQSIIVEKPPTLKWISGVNDATSFFQVEVYSPIIATEQDHYFFEVGEWYPVLYPGTDLRDFAKRDWTWTDQASVTPIAAGPFDLFNKMPLFFGGSYLVGKNVYRDHTLGAAQDTWPIFVSMTADKDKTYDSWARANGRPAVSYENLPIEKFKPTLIRFSGRIIEESFVNSLNNYQDPSQFLYPSELGRIRAMVNTANAQVESVGSILLVIGERETWSVYINRQTLEDLSGRTQVTEGDDVLGSYNTLLGSHGTMNPESTCKFRGRVYFYDALDASWIQYGRDGLTEISGYKMRNWFKELGDLIVDKYMSADRPLVLSEFDPFNNELISFQDHSSLPSTFRNYPIYKGALFSDDDNRWKSTHSIEPEMMSKMNNQVISFKNGDVWRNEILGTNYSTFFNVKKDVYFEPVFNDSPNTVKGWEAIAYLTTEGWSAERILSEYRGLKTKQQTSMPQSMFQWKEDNFYSEIRRDQTTPNMLNPAIEGNQMRSKALQVLMKLDPAIVSLSLLHYAAAVVIDSKKNP